MTDEVWDALTGPAETQGRRASTMASSCGEQHLLSQMTMLWVSAHGANGAHGDVLHVKEAKAGPYD